VKEGCFLLHILNRFMIPCGVIGNLCDKEIECFHSCCIHNFIIQHISDKMVWPNQWTFPISPDTVLKMPEREVCISNDNLII
jgi:hypothetical protein